MVYFTLKFHILSGRTEENYEENLARIRNRLAEICTRDIPTTKQQYQPFKLRNNRSLEVLVFVCVLFVYRTHLLSKFSKKKPSHVLSLKCNIIRFLSAVLHINRCSYEERDTQFTSTVPILSVCLYKF